MYKTYIIVLYTCACSRAVHLDPTPDATGQAFVQSFKVFIGRRGPPTVMIPDNGKTSKDKNIKGFASCKNVEWLHIVERSP